MMGQWLCWHRHQLAGYLCLLGWGFIGGIAFAWIVNEWIWRRRP